MCGIMCANFGHSRGTTRQCKGVWHPRCYQQGDKDNFPVLKAKDLDDALMDDEDPGETEDDPDRFKVARAGDHFMTPFQCDDCTFYNIQERYPGDSMEDQLLCLCIRRAQLDAFWAREPSTVAGNLRELRMVLKSSQQLGIENPLPDRGPFPIGDHVGMRTACALLMRTLNAGKNAEMVQFETARKARSTVSNFMHTIPGGTSLQSVGYGERGGTFFSNSPTNSYWFKRFLSGCHKRMGDVWLPDKALTLDVLLGCLEILEKEFSETVDGQRRLEVGLTGAMLVASYMAALRGEEVPLIDIGMMRKYWKESISYARKPHVTLALVGRFKQTNGATKTFIQPLAIKSSSGVENELWLGRAIDQYNKMGVVSGPMFRTVSGKGVIKRATVSDMDSLFHDVLRRLQVRRPDLIGPDIKVEDEYSMRRSPRRGSTTEAQNRKIPIDIVEINNRWKKYIRARGVLPSMSMIERYTDAKASVESLVQFSELQ